MDNRRENLKKSLGISEYPWSSDDDENNNNNDNQGAQNLIRMQSAEPRSSVANAPGPSGVSPSNPFARRRVDDWGDQAFWGMRRPVHNQLNCPAANRPRLLQDRPSSFSHPRNINHVPDPEAQESNAEMTANADLQRIMAIKKLTRNIRERRRINSLCAMTSRANARALEIGNIRHNPIRPYFPRYCRVGDPSTSGMGSEDEPHHHGCVSQIRLMRSNTAVDLSHTAPAPLSVDISRSDDDTEPENEPMVVNRDENDTQEPIAEASTSHETTPGVTMEEEIVELDPPDDDTNEDTDNRRGDVAMNDATANNNDDDAQEGPEADAERQDTESEADGTKRRKSGDVGFHTAREFNQGLLRLLECPVCLEWMEPPIAQCRRGHLVCVRCRSRLNACPVCRTVFSSVRNRAMEGVAEMLRYPCRHGCGREVRLRKRSPHEASCPARRYQCVAPACKDAPPLPHSRLAHHFQNKHMSILKIGCKHQFSIKVNAEQHDDCVIMALDQIFHLKIDVDIRTWGIIIYVAFMGPKSQASNYTYEVVVTGQHHSRKLVYTRVTHSDLESSSVNVSRQDCFHLTLDQALNFLRIKNKQCEPDKSLEFNLTISKREFLETQDSES